MAISVDIEKKLHGFTLKVKLESDGSPMGILGASGSGKSMTLRCIAGIQTPDSGRIVVNDKVLFDSEKKINLKPQERKVGYLFQNYALFPTMTVEKNIACGYRGDKKQLKAKVADYIERYQLNGLEKRYPGQLSGGQQQRVALARMMIGEPEIILLDEPFSALDGYLKDIMQRDMQNFLNEYTGDMILVTHSRDEAYKFCGHLTILDSGQALTTGETKKLFERPGILQAARLTGCKNFSTVQKMGKRIKNKMRCAFAVCRSGCDEEYCRRKEIRSALYRQFQACLPSDRAGCPDTGLSAHHLRKTLGSI